MREWFTDGPLLPIEFTRQSTNGRLTLVITPSVKPVRTLWALMATDDLEVAINSLRVREGIGQNINERITSVRKDEYTNDEIKTIIKTWAIDLNLDAVIWTNLHARFQETDNRIPSLEEVIAYFNSPDMDINTRTLAEEYIRRAPKQIDTIYRRRFEAEFGWTYIEYESTNLQQ